MPSYEHVFLARQDVSSAQVEALTKEYSQIITDGGGKVGKTEYWGLRNLAYPIKNGIPIMLADEARELSDDELK